MQTKPSSQLCKTLTSNIRGGGRKTSFQTSCLFFPGSKARIVRLHHQSWHQTFSTHPSFPDCWEFQQWHQRLNGQQRLHSSLPQKVWTLFLVWAGLGEWFEEKWLVTPCAVPTRCIKRGLQPLRQTRWHLSQVQILLLELFVVELESALEISTQSLQMLTLTRAACLQVCAFILSGSEGATRIDQVFQRTAR